MWIAGSMMFIMAALLVLGLMFVHEKALPGPVSAEWDSDQAMIAPGLEDRVVQNRWRRVKQTSTTDISQPS
jgi:hypothetical protein